MIASPQLDTTLASWNGAHYGLSLMAGPGTVGIYTSRDEGMTATRVKPCARVTGFEIMPLKLRYKQPMHRI